LWSSRNFLSLGTDAGRLTALPSAASVVGPLVCSTSRSAFSNAAVSLPAAAPAPPPATGRGHFTRGWRRAWRPACGSGLPERRYWAEEAHHVHHQVVCWLDASRGTGIAGWQAACTLESMPACTITQHVVGGHAQDERSAGTRVRHPWQHMQEQLAGLTGRAAPNLLRPQQPVHCPHMPALKTGQPLGKPQASVSKGRALGRLCGRGGGRLGRRGARRSRLGLLGRRRGRRRRLARPLGAHLRAPRTRAPRLPARPPSPAPRMRSLAGRLGRGSAVSLGAHGRPPRTRAPGLTPDTSRGVLDTGMLASAHFRCNPRKPVQPGACRHALSSPVAAPRTAARPPGRAAPAEPPA